jgi:phospholipid/cholesterol/gamma-HCH transport system substrate-binding protein
MSRTSRSSRSVLAPLVKLTVFAAVTIVLTSLLASALGSMSGSGGTPYRARFTDVTGLLPGDDVRIAGVAVGEVTAIRLAGTVAEVEFTVDSQIPVPDTVMAKIRYRNLIGQRYLALVRGPDAGAGPGGTGGPGRLAARGLIPLSRTTPALDLTVVFNGFRPLFTGLDPADVNRLSYEIIQVLQGEGGTVASLLRHTASLTTALADRDAVIGRVVTNLSAVLGTLADRAGALDQTIAALRQLVSGLANDRGAIGAALGPIADLADATGSLLRDARPDLAQDLTLLDTLAGTLNDNSAVIDATLRKLPDRYAALTRTASYGSWFSFFLCDVDGRVALGPGLGVTSPSLASGAARCAAAGAAPGGGR